MERSLRNIVTPQLTHASRTLEVSRIWDPFCRCRSWLSCKKSAWVVGKSCRERIKLIKQGVFRLDSGHYGKVVAAGPRNTAAAAGDNAQNKVGIFILPTIFFQKIVLLAIAVSILRWTVLNVVNFWDSTSLNTKIWAVFREGKTNFISPDCGLYLTASLIFRWY